MQAEDLDPDRRRAWQEKITDSGYYDLLSLIRFVTVFHQKPPAYASLQDLLEKVEQLPAATTALPKDQALLLYARAFDLINRMSPAEWRKRAAMRETMALLNRSLAIYPSSENPAAESLLKVLDGLVPRDDAALADLRSRYPSINK